MNKVVLIGRLTKDAELRYTPSTNKAVGSFTLAVDRRFKSEGQPTADFINCVAWGKTAEFISNYFKKGNKLGVCGRIQTRTWDDTENKRHYVTEVVVEEAYFVESKGSSNQNDNYSYNSNDNFGDNSKNNNNMSATSGYFPIDDDGDIPF